MEDWTKAIEEKLGVKVERYEYQHLVPELPPLELRPIRLVDDLPVPEGLDGPS